MINRFNLKVSLQEESDCPDLEYNYGDTDTYLCEMAELYSYSELEDFQANIQVPASKNRLSNNLIYIYI